MSEKLLSALIICLAHDGYRRAGFAFNKGENLIEGVSEEAVEVINSDPFLTVREVDGEAYGEANSEEQTIDVSEIPEHLLPIVQTMLLGHKEQTLKLNAKGVPDIAELEKTIKWPDGCKTKLTAALRDEAWVAASDFIAVDDSENEGDA
tara:strand:+ start:20302 stop:20748 length:447 start_codon:yes stop_codon:yes gene_type:complete